MRRLIEGFNSSALLLFALAIICLMCVSNCGHKNEIEVTAIKQTIYFQNGDHITTISKQPCTWYTYEGACVDCGGKKYCGVREIK